MNCLQRCLLSILILFITITAPACAGSWVPVDGPCSAEAEQTLFHWVQQQIATGNITPSSKCHDARILRNLIRGTLVWAYTYGCSFDAETFLHHFANRDDSVKYLQLQNGGLIFILESCNLKISRDNCGPENRISDGKGSETLRERWYASAFNNEVEISFYFSAVGPYSKTPR